MIAKPGETLVVKAGRSATPEHLNDLSELIRARVAEGVEVLVLGGDIDRVDVVAKREADRIAEAVRKATLNPGHTVNVEDQP